MAPCIKRDAEAGGLSVLNKKRKYSPIEWDKDNKVCKLSTYNGISSPEQPTNSFLSTGSLLVSTGISQSAPPVKSVVSGVCGTDGVSCARLEGKYGGDKVEYEIFAELHNISSCRWLDDLLDGEIADSPLEGKYGGDKKLEYEDFAELHNNSSCRWLNDLLDGEIADSPLEGKYGGDKKLEYEDFAELHNNSSCRWLNDLLDGEIADSPLEGKYGGDKVEYEDCAELHKIKSCRWLLDDLVDGEIADSPLEGKYGGDKKMEYEDFAELQNISSCRWLDDLVDGEIADMVMNLVSSPQFVERKREGSEGRSCGSSNKGSNCSGDSSERHLDIDTDVEYGSWETPEPAAPLQRSVNMLQACRSVNEFENLGKIGEGAYGVVYKARNKKTGEIVSLKKVKMDNDRQEGFPLTSLREINILKSSDHPSIINLKEVVKGSSSNCVFLVMEYMNYDLEAVMRRRMKQPFCQSEVKCLMLQLLQGVKYLHDNLVLHRDLKTSNLLLNRRGELKICDLGMARRYEIPAKPYTQLVVTIWYRAPELLLGAKQYSTAVDMWSVGCIMAELLLNEPLFTGYTEIEQIERIFRMLGTPNETSWPGFSKLPGAKARFVKKPYNLLRNKFSAASFSGAALLSQTGFDLLDKLLTCNPAKRITADEALNHQWFREFPLPKSKDCMPTF